MISEKAYATSVSAEAAGNPTDSVVQGRIALVFWIAVVVLGGFQFWISRQTMNTDGISYLDMADALARGDWRVGINAYWSPLYPCLLALGRLILKPSVYWEFTVVHLVNFFIFVAAAAAFHFFMNTFLAYFRHVTAPRESQTWTPLPGWVLLVLGYVLFLWSTLTLINLSTVSPDLTVAIFVFLAFAVILRMKMDADGSGEFVLLGIVLGFAYWAKAAMLPLGLVFFFSAFLAASRSGSQASSSMMSALVNFNKVAQRLAMGMGLFLFISAPLIVAISHSKGRLTIGDSARLNWAYYINHVPRYHWQGLPPAGAPLHPTRKIFTSPGVYEFDSPTTVTYDIWYDPSYWDDGIRPHIDIKSNIRRLIDNSYFYFGFFFRVQIGITAACVFLFFIGGQGKRLLADLADYREELLPPLAAMAMYAPVYVETRYLAPFVVVLWMGLFAAVKLSHSGVRRRMAACAVGVAVAFTLLALAISMRPPSTSSVAELSRWKSPHPQYQVAEELHRMGVEPGDKVAWIRPRAPLHGEPSRERYDWARLARLRIIAEIPGIDEKTFWESSSSTQSQVIKALAGTGAKALISTQPPTEGSKLPWRPIGATGFYLVFLSQAA